MKFGYKLNREKQFEVWLKITIGFPRVGKFLHHLHLETKTTFFEKNVDYFRADPEGKIGLAETQTEKKGI